MSRVDSRISPNAAQNISAASDPATVPVTISPTMRAAIQRQGGDQELPVALQAVVVVVRVHPGQANSVVKKRVYNYAEVCAYTKASAAVLSPSNSTSLSVRLAFRVGEAAHVLGVSEDFFTGNIAPELRCVRRGRVKLYPLRELERWLDENASTVFDD